VSRAGIFQVLGNVSNYREVEFVIEDESYKRVLSSLAVRDWLRERGIEAKVYFLVPESLIERLADGTSAPDISILQDRKEYEKLVKEKVGEDAEYRTISSVGKFGKYEFTGSVDHTIIDIFRVAYEEKLDVVVGDISTGLNVYSATMIEALRKYVTYRKLENALQESEKFGMKLVFLPPVLDARSLNVEIQEVGIKAFFDVPDVSVREAFSDKEVSRKFGREIKHLGKAMKIAKVGCNAINLNTPLAFYHREIVDFDFDVENAEKGLWKILDFVARPSIDPSGDGFKISRATIRGNAVFNLLFSLAIAKTLRKFASTLSDRAELRELLKAFGEVYDRLGLKVNRRLLERDVEGMLDKVPDGFTGLYLELFENSGKSTDQVRNFFAHSGFLREVTFVSREGEKVYVWWDEDELKAIKRWITSQ